MNWRLGILHDGVVIVILLLFGGGRGGEGAVGCNGSGAIGCWGCRIVVWVVADGHCFKKEVAMLSKRWKSLNDFHFAMRAEER